MGTGISGSAVNMEDVSAEAIEQPPPSAGAQAAHDIETAEEVEYLKASERLEDWVPPDRFMSGPPWKFVWYSSAEDYPNSELLDPVWKEASQIWQHFKGNTPDIRLHVDWMHKDCYGPGWTRGADYDDCPNTPVKTKYNADHLSGLRTFPTLRLYGPMGQTDFHGQRTTQNLLNFVRKYVDPPEYHETRNPRSVIDDPPHAVDVEAPQEGTPRPPPQPVEPTQSALERTGTSDMGFAVGTLGAVVVDASREELRERRHLRSHLPQSSNLPCSRAPELPRNLLGNPGSQVPGRPAGHWPSLSAGNLECQRRQQGPLRDSSSARRATLWSFL
mmetsp:Transcript_28145/g.51143  ORF Transcript_28145/g.51143 Transcript_28145/m.51143 type:complete len:330 (-) Transcript_28145:63-1052(-)